MVGSFVSALDARDLRRAYGYLDSRWREGRGPVRAPHAFGPFAASYRSITCARLAQADSYDRSEDGKWNTVRAWIAVRRGDGPTRLMFGNFWTHSDTARPPWSLIGFWTRELAAR